MIISEKQILRMFGVFMLLSVDLSLGEDVRKVLSDLCLEIKNQQSEELKEIK